MIKYWTNGVYVEPQAEQQLRNIESLPILHDHIAVMPDVHLGKGATVGSVIPTRDAIIPAAVGVDLSCGMVASKLTLKAKDLPESLLKLRLEIESAVPVGAASHTDIPNAVSKTWYSILKEDFENLQKRMIKSQLRNPPLFN